MIPFGLIMNLPSVTIVIPSYNSEKTISEALEGCLKQDYPLEKMEIIVVDDGSIDATKSVIGKYNVRYRYQQNNGPASARNNGWRHANSEIVAFLDSDCVPRRNWIKKMMMQYTSDDIVCVGSRYGIANPRSLLACCIYFEFLVRYKRMPRHPKFLGSHGYSFRKSFLESINGYNEGYTMASHEDNELAYRIVAKGYYTVFDKSNIVDHYFPTGMVRYLTIQFWHGFWRMKLYVDHPRMVIGDDYSDLWDYMQPPLMVLLLALSPFIFINAVIPIVLGLLCCLIFLQLPITVSIVTLIRKKRYVVYIPFGIVRAGARCFGMIIGIIYFWIQRKK
ncbi:MAG: glycosyltransferase [Candidatus Omnitrophica bacterium]|nr:glycosyltransferase [Candidatus Omnitrophota bacterium]